MRRRVVQTLFLKLESSFWLFVVPRQFQKKRLNEPTISIDFAIIFIDVIT